MDDSRSVVMVIEDILKIVPLDQVELINEINIYKKSLWNKAPETLLIGETWIPFIMILNKFIPDIRENWQIEIHQFLNNSK